MGINYKQTASNIIKAVGGQENIQSVAHCSTRLRLIVSNKQIIDEEVLEKIESVKGIFFNAGQLQIILGTGVVNKVYDEVMKLGVSETTKQEARNVKEEGTNKVQKAIRTFGDIFVPIIPALVATGFLLGLKGALLNNQFLELFGLSSSMIPESILVLSDVLTSTTFAFMPALVCWSAFKVFGGSPILGLVLGLMLVSPALPNAYSVADPNSGITPLYLFNWIPIVGYQGSILPAVAAGFIGAKFEKKLRASVPETFDFMITPFTVLVVMMILSLVVIGPILHIFENGILIALEEVIHLPFGLGGLIIGTLWSAIVLTGVHHISNMLEISLLASTGFNPFNAIITMGGFVNAAVCLAISMKAKKRAVKSIGPGASMSSLLGIGEPALFGVILRYSIKPFIILSIVSGIAGMASNLLGLQGSGNGVSTLPGILLYIYDSHQLIGYICVAALSFTLAFILTWMFGVPKEVMKED